jgi:hypothetical protein
MSDLYYSILVPLGELFEYIRGKTPDAVLLETPPPTYESLYPSNAPRCACFDAMGRFMSRCLGVGSIDMVSFAKPEYRYSGTEGAALFAFEIDSRIPGWQIVSDLDALHLSSIDFDRVVVSGRVSAKRRLWKLKARREGRWVMKRSCLFA